MRPSYVQTVAPTEPLVSVDDVILQARIDGDEDRPLIENLIHAATEYVQKKQWSQLVSATWAMRMCTFPCDKIELHPNPVSSVSSVTYVDTAGATQTLTENTDYVVDTNCQPAVIRPAYNRSWPTARGYANDVIVTVVAGYGAAGAVPQSIKQAILILVNHWYQGCADQASIPMAAEALLSVQSYEGFA